VTATCALQHDESVTNEKIAADLMEHVIKPVVPAKYLDDNTIFHLNPSGRFVIGGPHGDAGLTGRKIIIDTYGAGARTEGVRSRARIPRRSTGRGPTLCARLPRALWLPASPGAPWSR